MTITDRPIRDLLQVKIDLAKVRALLATHRESDPLLDAVLAQIESVNARVTMIVADLEGERPH